MSQACSFYLACYDSPSGYYRVWSTDGFIENVAYPHDGRHGSSWMEHLILTPGQYLLLESLPNDDTPAFTKLIRTPLNKNKFKTFCEKSAVAGQEVYDRLMSYRSKLKTKKIKRDYSNDFLGSWLEEYVVNEWHNSEFRPDLPENIRHAIEISNATQ